MVLTQHTNEEAHEQVFQHNGNTFKCTISDLTIKHVWYKVRVRSQMGLQDWRNGYEIGIMPANGNYNYCQTELHFSSKYCISTAYLYYNK